jgi:hypothetical protein
VRRYRWIVPAGIILQTLTVAARAEDYWTYSYENIEVTAPSASEASTMVRNIYRLDQSARRLLGSTEGEKPRTYVYAVPKQTFQRISGNRNATTQFTILDGENFVLLDTSDRGSEASWNTYFGYSGSILLSGGILRYPDWFRAGFSELLAATQVNGTKVTLGGASTGRVYTLENNPLIPVRTLLELHRNDPQLNTATFAQMFSAESWLLTHLILFESRYQSEFTHYFKLIDQGQSPEDAFAASFKVGYQDLDKMVHDTLRGGIQTYIFRMPEDASDSGQPHRITAAEANARFGVITARLRHGDEGHKFADAALATEPGNGTAIEALALSQLSVHQYAAALQTSSRFANDALLSASGHAVRAMVLTDVATQIEKKEVTVDADPKELLRRAAEDYQQAITLDPERLSYWTQFARFLGRHPNSKVLETFFPQVVHTFFQHPHVASLARAVTEMCTAANDYTNALRFASAWRQEAITAEDRDAASAAVSHLKALIDQRDATSGGPPDNTAVFTAR